MSNIIKYGVAFPHFRIADNILHPRLGRKGKHAVCYTDEDIITLAYQACSNLKIVENIDAILFATTTPVFSDRYHASFLADLLGLPNGIFAIDLGTTPRAGTDALILADKLIKSGVHKNVLVIAVNVNFPPIGNEISTSFGHGAVALIVSNEKGLAEITDSQSFSSAIAEEFIYKGEDVQYDARFARTAGFVTNIGLALKKNNINPTSVNNLIVNSLYAKLAFGQFKKSGFDIEKQLSKDTVTPDFGHTGACHGLLLLINAIESQSGSTVLFDYFNGTNVISLSSQAVIAYPVLKNVHATFLDSYQDYLQLRKQGNFESKSYHSHEMFSSEMLQEREKDNLVYLKGFECVSCGTVYFMKAARCNSCHKTEFKTKQLSKTGTVFTITSEHYFPASFSPTNMVVVDLDGGGRITVQQTDDMFQNENTILKIGDKVSLVYRKMMENDKKPNYFWKCKKL
ncbi:MAG: hypothetical protein A2046_14365 [Bacteroidetes bacterium GWA2_30_7]|nr:MAG: hypothetical protein A2046_14365 [Bacteroidetes bacterium GWA2_30_7]